MAQHDYILENQPGAAFRGDLNAAMQAIVSQNSGSTEPTTTYPYQFWADTTEGILKQRNAVNNAWINIFSLSTGDPSSISSYAQLSGATFTGPVSVPSLNGGQLAGMRNKIINGNFGVNQRSVSGTVTLAAGAYGHDRWKAGASGCTYTYATTQNVTTITITSGSLVQVIEGLNLQSGTHVLSWQGTSQGRIGTGSYGASGAVTVTAVGGTNQTIEFNAGTVSLVQYEPGTVATPFEHRPYGVELSLCQRYYEWLGGGLAYANYVQVSGLAYNRTNFVKFSTVKRVTPTGKIVDYWTGNVVASLRYGGGNSSDASVQAVVVTSTDGVFGTAQATGPTASSIIYNNFIADAEL